MRRLTLFRHGKTEPASPAGDHGRRLTAGGRADAWEAGNVLAERTRPGLALVSDARRARETFDGLAEAFGGEIPHRIEPGLYGASAERVLEIIAGTPSSVESLLIIGHNPGLGDLARRLAGTGPVGAGQRLERFPTSAFAILDLEDEAWSGAGRGGRLVAFETPRSEEP